MQSKSVPFYETYLNKDNEGNCLLGSLLGFVSLVALPPASMQSSAGMTTTQISAIHKPTPSVKKQWQTHFQIKPSPLLLMVPDYSVQQK